MKKLFTERTASIGAYVSSLVKSFKTDDVRDEIDALSQQLAQQTLPPFKLAVKAYGNDKLLTSTKLETQLINVMKSTYTHRYKGNYLNAIEQALENLDNYLDEVSVLADDVFTSKDVHTSDVNLKQATILRFVDMAGFFTGYAGNLLDYLLVQKVAEERAGKEDIILPLKPEETALQDSQLAFVICMDIINNGNLDISKMVSDLPAVAVSVNSAALLDKTYDRDKIDPIRMNILPLKLNPAFHIGMARATWQANRYEAAQETRRSIENRLLYLERLAQGEENAKLEEQIEYNTGRLRAVKFKLAKWDKKYGL